VFLGAEPGLPATSTDQPILEAAPDGQVTAEQIVRTWDLDAELVVLSVCESGLGRYSGGEGYLGFAQALFAKGARSLVLSQWKVDDKATALLMTRFYQNMLGTREGMDRPLRKSDALREAKQWLREMSARQVGTELEKISRGVPRSKEGDPVPGRPFEHPYYWAAFILIGNPD
jgi:CHAT domain-containing protein